MINTIGEFTAQQILRTNQESAIGDQSAIVQKSIKASIARPVDKTINSRRSDMHKNAEEKKDRCQNDARARFIHQIHNRPTGL